MRKHIITALIGLLLLSPNCFLNAEDEHRQPLPSILPLSPNVAAFAQYVDYPVSHYSGVPQITIPLYEADIYGYKLPISLSYHASGIRVSQEASWVGLGWNLNVGGMISRTIKGGDDLVSSTLYGSTVQGYYHAPEIEGASTSPPASLTENEFYDCRDWGGAIRLKVDPEPDVFYYTIPGASGKFLLDKSRGPVVFHQNDQVKIEIIKHPTTANYYTFQITAPDGTIYEFIDKQEKTTNYAETNKHLNKNYTIENKYDSDKIAKSGGSYVSAWMLTKIILTNKKEIQFTYEEEETTSPAQESLRIYHDEHGTKNNITNVDCSFALGKRYSVSKSSTDGYRLSKIEWEGGEINFVAVDRLDLNGSSGKRPKALDAIKVYNKEKELVKQYDFTYSYFNKNYLNTTSEEEYIYMRLKLDKVQEISKANTKLNGHKFTYHSGKMPPKNSKNTDYWGYQNGENYGDNYCVHKHTGFELLPGVAKDSDLSYLRIGTLSQIDLPTGGNVKYEYELNSFSGSFAYENKTEGAGLRVKEITSYDGSKTKSRKFVYSKGILLAPPVHYFYDVVCPGQGRSRDTNCLVQISEPKLPLNSFSNGNLVGYTKVEEQLIEGGKTFKTQYEFYNDMEEERHQEVAHDFPRYPEYYNGLPQTVTYLEDDKILQKVQYKYKSTYSSRVSAFRWDPMLASDFTYDYSACWIQKEKETTYNYIPGQDTPLITEQQYEYNDYFLLSSSKLITNNDNNEILEQRILYPTDYTNDLYIEMAGAHIINAPIEIIELRNEELVSAKKTEYKKVDDMYLPDSISTVNMLPEVTLSNYQNYYIANLTFNSYNTYGKVTQITAIDKTPIVYLWGYNGQYPIAEIKNATYNDVSGAIPDGSSLLSSIASGTSPTSDDWSKIKDLQNNASLKNAQTVIYKYKPLVGVTEITDPRGVSTYYSYDDFGRLITITDTNKNIIQSNTYNYQ